MSSMKVSKSILAINFILMTGIICGSAAFARLFLLSGPWVLYSFLHPQLRSQCYAIHPSMTLYQVEDLVDTSFSPEEESLTGTTFTFGAREMCVVELDSTSKVLKAHVSTAQVHMIE